MRRAIGVSAFAAVLVAAACAAEDTSSLSANFLVVAGDSTFWVTTDSSPPAVRRSPIFLARVDGRLQEIYLADDDRSYYDAVIVGHRVYRRDIVRGDSTAIFEDSTIASVAAAYASAHPDERPLQPGEDEADDPDMVSTSETEIIDVLGPFVTLEQHVDLDLPNGGEMHETRRLVVDMRSGKSVGLADLMPDTAVQRVVREARRARSAAFDSVRRSRDARAPAATAMLRDFVLDPTSFTLTTTASGPAVAFFMPGRGLRAGGYALPLPPIAVPGGDWWEFERAVLPNETSDDKDVWRGSAYHVVARYDSTAGDALVVIQPASGRELAVGRVPTPVERVIRLDDASFGPEALRALARAFDEAAHYSKPLRTTSAPAPPARGAPVSLRGREGSP